MSLTNDMLNNLEKRRSLNSDQGSIFSGLEATASGKSHYRTYALYISIIFFLFSGAFCFSYIVKHDLPLHAKQTASTIIKIPSMHFNVSSKNMETPAAVPVKTVANISIQDQALQEYQDALAFIAQNQTSAATEKLNHIIKIAPTYQDARTTLATLYLENNEVNNATQLLTDGLAIEPNNMALTLLFARALIMQGHDQAALLALKNISAVAGNNTAYMDLLASVQEALGHYGEAISLYQSLLYQDPSNNRWLISLGTALEHTGQKNAALNAYQKAMKLGQLPPDLQNYVTNRIHYLGS